MNAGVARIFEGSHSGIDPRLAGFATAIDGQGGAHFVIGDLAIMLRMRVCRGLECSSLLPRHRVIPEDFLGAVEMVLRRPQIAARCGVFTLSPGQMPGQAKPFLTARDNVAAALKMRNCQLGTTG